MTEIALVSYGFAALAFLLLGALLVASWRGGRPGLLLIVAVALTATWCGLAALASTTTGISRAAVLVAENLRNGSWLVFLTVILSIANNSALRRQALRIVHVLWLLPLSVALVKATGWSLWPLHLVGGKTVLLGQLVVALAGLVLIEQIYRNTAPESKWKVKYLCLGIGALFAYDLLLYAHAFLFVSINASIWDARGLVNAMTVPLLAIAARRNPVWSLDIFVSRQAVFFGGSLIAVGIYLVAMAGGGYYIRAFGGTWATFGQIVFLCAAILGLVIVAMSGEVRRRLKVFVSKHFYRNKYDYREEWLRLNETLASESGSETLYERVIQAMAQILESPGGCLLRLRGNNFVVTHTWKMSIPAEVEQPVASDFCKALEADAWVVDSLQATPLPQAAGELPAWIQNLSFPVLVIPLIAGIHLHGILVLRRPPEPFALSYEDIDLLRTVGRQLANFLAQHELDRQLAESRQFEAYNRLTSFLMHDLKNLIAQQSMVVRNAAKHKSNPEFIDDAIDTIDNSTRRMQRLLQQLKAGAIKEPSAPVDLAKIIKEVVSDWSGRCELVMNVEAEDCWVGAGAERLAMVLRHIIKNAEDASEAHQQIRVELRAEAGRAEVLVVDRGRGMDREFIRDRLFRPFDSTKGSQGMGIGAYQVREFARELGGDVSVVSEPNQGTTFSLALPIIEKSG